MLLVLAAALPAQLPATLHFPLGARRHTAGQCIEHPAPPPPSFCDWQKCILVRDGAWQLAGSSPNLRVVVLPRPCPA